MTYQEQLESLLARYVERRVAGADPPDPKDLCTDAPELVEPLRSLVREYESLARGLGRIGLEAGDLFEPPPPTRAPPERNVTGAQTLYPGYVLSRRFRLCESLGHGGQGEVWRAVDLKLRVDVALKTVRADRAHPGALDRLRREVLAARSVTSPNVCRIFDLIDAGSEELVSMEFVDGTTLLEALRERAPLPLEEALEIASQLLEGLDAIHAAGLVHRDVKPENIMLTRAGRVVVMDLGLARSVERSGSASIAGTPPYMAPEHARGDAIDARADIYSVGVLLAEMVQPSGLADGDSRERVWREVRRRPPVVADTPWKPVLERALSPDPAGRFDSARELARELERATHHVLRGDAAPYPGLAAFDEETARFFFGRAAETEALWRKLEAPPRLLAVVGSSGAGKTSFLRAGVLASRPAGWSTILVRPGAAPFVALGQAVGEELAGDPRAAAMLVRFPESDVAVELLRRWRELRGRALLVVDQFEELFTRHPDEIQLRFVDLLGRLPLEAEIHVVLGLRDDFLLACHRFEALTPIFSELTPLAAPKGAALRRALVQPASRCGFRFEDDALVAEMLAAVEGERGALPLLAYAAAALWERRDHGAGLLTRDAYQEIGGVAGALAGHAEATLARIGQDRLPLVRDLFRNLVTPQGTRASRGIEELLSVAEDRDAAREVVATLVDARLLTAYETPSPDERVAPERRVEIVHESLLSAWPRLVRWRTQDADAALMREQVRQAAQIWEDKGRAEELLWTGASYREFAVWRERYPGRLTDLEQAFGRAMVVHAGRRRRRRRLLAAFAAVALAAVASTLGIFWRASEAARRQESQALAAAEHQAQLAESGRLLALAQSELKENPTAALAYALASLERADEPAARRFAVEALYGGPVAYRFPGTHHSKDLAFSPDGNWLASGSLTGEVELWARSGGPARLLEKQRNPIPSVAFGPRSDLLIVGSQADSTVSLWSIPEGRLLRRIPTRGFAFAWPTDDGEHVVTMERKPDWTKEFEVQVWPLTGGRPAKHGRLVANNTPDVDATGSWLVAAEGRDVKLYRVEDLSAPAAVVGRHASKVSHVAIDPGGRRAASMDETGELAIWSLTPPHPRLERRLSIACRPRRLRFDASGSRLAVGGMDGLVRIVALDGRPGSEPLLLQPVAPFQWTTVAFSPDGEWIGAGNHNGVFLFPLRTPLPTTLGEVGSPPVFGLALAPDGSWIAGSIQGGPIRFFPRDPGAPIRDLRSPGWLFPIRLDPKGRQLLGAAINGRVYLVPVNGGEPRVFEGFSTSPFAVAFARDGDRIAAAGGAFEKKDALIRVWDLGTGGSRVLDAGDGRGITALEFLPAGDLVSGSRAGVRRWNPEDGSFQTLRAADWDDTSLAVAPDGRYLLSASGLLPGESEPRPATNRMQNHEIRLDDLATGRSRYLPAWGLATCALALDPSGGVLLSGDYFGVLRAGTVTGGEPHLLFGHRGFIHQVAATPDGRQVVSAGNDGTIRLWPMPDLSRPPLHTLPREDLLAKLRAFTNLRVVVDPTSRTGYALESEPFPGWSEPPTW